MPKLSDQSNIVRLYEELGVRPDQGVARLTERYRQRLRELHPDGRDDITQVADEGIGWITRSYRDAVAFERQHGRLPGAGQAGGIGTPAATTQRRPRHRTTGIGVPDVAPIRQLWRWLVFAAALALLIAFMAPELAPIFSDGTDSAERTPGTRRP